MDMIANHAEQIALSSAALSNLPFPPPKIFTNALLHQHDITALIRDTEAHERALFTVSLRDDQAFDKRSRKSTFYDLHQHELSQGSQHTAAPRATSAVSRVLGGDLLKQMKSINEEHSRDRSDLDVPRLFDGAEHLCSVYPIPGALAKIQSLRQRYDELAASLQQCQDVVAQQRVQLEQIKEDETRNGRGTQDPDRTMPTTVTAEDLKREEEEVRALEEMKRTLEERVEGMSKDIGGLRR